MTTTLDRPIRVVVWNEYLHERQDAPVKELYPDGMHAVIGGALERLLGDDVVVTTATLEEPEHGLSEEVLDRTDVMLWWGHRGHDRVEDKIAEKVQYRVLDGMGFIGLHSAHYAKPFRLLMGTSCRLEWREIDDTEFVWTVSPTHPIAEGIPHPLIVPKQECYAEYFDIPAPDEQVFLSTYSKSVEVFRSGCVFRRGRGRIFYFSPGHETYPVFHQPEIQQVIANAVRWAHQPKVSPIDNTGNGNGPKPIVRRREEV